MIVGTADDRVCVLEFAVEVFSVLPVSDLDMHEQPLGHLVKLMANSFDEQAVMADPLIDVLEPVINALVPVVYLLESEINLPEPAINLLKSEVNLPEPAIKLLEPEINLPEPAINLLESTI